MAKAKKHPIITSISGQIGELVFRQVGGETVIGLKPDLSHVVPSEAQLVHQQRFREAVQYAQVALAIPETEAIYAAAARERQQPLFSVAVADFLNAPLVTLVDAGAYTGQAGQVIVVQAQDDVRVTAVTVTLTDSSGAVLESGAAQANPPHSGRWTYATTAVVSGPATVHITAVAADMPGHVGQAEVEVVLG